MRCHVGHFAASGITNLTSGPPYIPRSGVEFALSAPLLQGYKTKHSRPPVRSLWWYELSPNNNTYRGEEVIVIVGRGAYVLELSSIEFLLSCLLLT